MKKIDKTEKDYLIQQKLREGKGVVQAESEVERDIEYLNGLEEMKKRLQKEVKQLEKEKIDVSKRFKKEFQKLQKQPDDKFKKSKTALKSATTKHLNRILYYLKDFPNVNVTTIARENCMDTSYARDGLRFLIKLKKVVEKRSHGDVSTYSLK